MNFRERKAERAEYYKKYVHGAKLRDCTACNGSGHYDNNGSPKCSSCNGTGKERYKPDPRPEPAITYGADPEANTTKEVNVNLIHH